MEKLAINLLDWVLDLDRSPSVARIKDMEEMGCGFKWLFVEEDLRNTPSFKTGVTASQEQTFRTKMAMLIQTIGSKSRLTQLAMNTSIIFMHRFFMYRTVRQYPRLHLAVAFAFAGGKVEESFCKLEHLVRSAVDVIRSNKNREFLDKSDLLTYEMDCLWRSKMEALLHSNCNTESGAYQDMRKIILECEAEIYAVIGFNLSIIHPHNFVVKMCSLLGSENTKDISHYAYNLATASSQLTMLCLKYKPEFIAIMCLSIAAKAHNVELRCLQDGKNWYQAFDESIVLADVEAVSREFVNLAKGYPFWKDANGQQVFLNRRNQSGQSRGQSSSSQSSRQQPAHLGHSTSQSNSSSLANPAQSHPASSSHSQPLERALRASPLPPQEVAILSSFIMQPQMNYSHSGGTGPRQNPADLRQNPANMGNGRNGSAGAVNIPRDQAHLSRNHRLLHPHGNLQQPTHQQQMPHHHHQHNHQHHHHYQQQQQQQGPPAPSTAVINSTTSRPSTVPASQPEGTRTLGRQSHSMTGSSHPQSLHHTASSSSLSHLTSSSSSGRDLPTSQALVIPGQTQGQPRALGEQGRSQLSQPTPQDMARSQSMHRLRPDAGIRPGEMSVDERRPRAHRSSVLAVPPPQQLQQQLHHHQPLAADLPRPQQEQLAASRQSQQAAAIQQQHRQQMPHTAQLGSRQQAQTAPLQHMQQKDRLASSAQQHLPLSHRQQQQQHHLSTGPSEAGELSPHTPPLPYPGDLVTPASGAGLPSATAVHTLPGCGSGDASQATGLPLSRQAPRNGQSQDIKDSSSLGSDSSTSKASSSTYLESSRVAAQNKPLLTEVQPEPSTSAPFLSDRVLKIRLEPCSSSPVQSAAKVKGEPLTSSPADDKMLTVGTSSFTKPQDSPSNPRIKIKVKRDLASNERHSVKYADSGLKIKIKPPRPEGETEVGPSASGHSSRSSTPREEGEVEGTPSPASSTSSGRKSEGLRIRLSVPKPDGSSSVGSKRDTDQWSNGVSSERESSGHRSHHNHHHHGRHHKSKKHSKHSRHEGKSSCKRSASGDVGEERQAKSSRTESSSSSLATNLSLQTGGYPGLTSTSSSSTSLSSFTTSDSLHHGGFSITEAFSSTMPNDIFDDDDEDTLPSIPLTPIDALPQAASRHERFQQMMNQSNANRSRAPPGPDSSGS